MHLLAVFYKATVNFTGKDYNKWNLVLTKPDMEIKYVNNSRIVYANSKAYTFPVPPMSIADKESYSSFDTDQNIIIPVRWLAGMSGATVDWVKTSIN
jgi:hypothetical protein